MPFDGLPWFLVVARSVWVFAMWRQGSLCVCLRVVFSSSRFEMKASVALICALLAALGLGRPLRLAAEVEAGTGDAGQAVMGSSDRFAGIVKIENAAIEPDYRTPWQGGVPGGGSGTGWLVGENLFMTNAHVVSNASRLTIRKVGNPEPLAARLIHIAHDCDLALLSLLDPSPFEGVSPLGLGGIPRLDTEVIAVGYPVGGDRLSVTRGVVSRIDFRSYSHSGVDQHLAIQIDAAINPGNSGGPVIQGGKVVGVAFQGLAGGGAQNVGYMIPVPVVERFLTDVEDGRYDHYVDLAIYTLPIQNPAQVKALGLPRGDRGVMVTSVDVSGSSSGILAVGDVLLEIEGSPVLSNGLIEVEGDLVDLNEIVERRFAGDEVRVKVWRDREEKELIITLQRFLPYLMMANQYDRRPKYVVYAGLVFQPLDRALINAHGIDDQVVNHYFGNFLTDEIYSERPEPVVLTSVLADAINTHLRRFAHSIVDEVNGRRITCLKDLHDALQDPEQQNAFVEIRLVEEGRPLVLERARVQAAQMRILRAYGVPLDHYLGEEG